MSTNKTRELSIDCCSLSISEIKCVNARVTEIKWFKLNLNGYINVTALKSFDRLFRLDVKNNKLSGIILDKLPDSITHMNFGANKLPGSLMPLPPNIQYFHCDNNFLTGNFPDIPDSMSNLRIDGNSFTGSIKINRPSVLEVMNTQISNLLINNTSLLNFTAPDDSPGFCDLSNTMVYESQVSYLSSVCHMSGVISLQCESVIKIANDLHLDEQVPSLFATLKGNCCNGYGISCDASRNVASINWSSLGLNGTLDSGKIASLSFLTTFNASSNNITGHILNGFNSNLQIIDLSYNLLNGTLRLHQLQMLNISKNQFTGISSNAPLNISTFDISHNYISGLIVFDSPQIVNIEQNQITDVLFNSSSELVNCNLLHNPLTGSSYPKICLTDPKRVTTVNSKSTLLATPTFIDRNSNTEILTPWVIVGLVCALFALFIIAFFAKRIFKHPQILSKFGRKNSFGTLNTVASKNNKPMTF